MGKLVNLANKDKVRIVGMTTAPKLKRRASDIFVGDQPSVGTNIHRSVCCV